MAARRPRRWPHEGEGDEDPQHQLEQHRDHREDQRHPGRVPEARVAGEEEIVPAPFEGGDAEDGDPPLQREPHHPQGGKHGDRGEHHERRRHERDAGAPTPAERPHSPSPARRNSRRRRACSTLAAGSSRRRGPRTARAAAPSRASRRPASPAAGRPAMVRSWMRGRLGKARTRAGSR